MTSDEHIPQTLVHKRSQFVFEHARKAGAHLIVLIILATYADEHGVWDVDQATLQRFSHLSRRSLQRVLADLVAQGEIAVVPGNGRGKLSTYRLLLLPDLAQPSAPCAAPAGAEGLAVSAPTGAAGLNLAGAAGTLSSALPEAPRESPAPVAEAIQPSAAPQSAALRVKLLLRETAVPLPTPAQIALWAKTLGGIEPLLELLRRLLAAGLAAKRHPIADIHRAVMEQATPGPLRYSIDERRRAQAARIAADRGDW
jgi:hypothetical protein